MTQKHSSPTINDVFKVRKISRNILSQLSQEDTLECSLVNKAWNSAVQDARSSRIVRITPQQVGKLAKKEKSLEDYLEDYKYSHTAEVLGWTKAGELDNDVYRTLFSSSIRAKVLNLRCRGKWTACSCPKEKSTRGEQIDTIKPKDLTKLECINIFSTFQISACALLDLVSRSPRLKRLRFYGVILNHDHTEKFMTKRFYSDMEAIYWPWTSSKHVPTLTTLVKRNENLKIFYCNSEITCDLLASEALVNVVYLSLFLNDHWLVKSGSSKRAAKLKQKINYLSLAKNVEALEVRTMENLDMDSPDDLKTNPKIDRIYEEFKITFWQQVSKLPKLKYLAIYGAWELERVCRELNKNQLQVEYLKTNLMPTSLLAAIEAQDDNPTLSMYDGLRNLKNLPHLKSLHFICYEKLSTIDEKTITAFKELVDTIWVLEAKTSLTTEMEDLLNNIMRRGNQLGKTYKFQMNTDMKDSEYVPVLTEHHLKFPMGTDLRAKLIDMAEDEYTKRYGKAGQCNIYIWRIAQVGNSRDRGSFDQIKSNWQRYDDVFSICQQYP